MNLNQLTQINLLITNLAPVSIKELEIDEVEEITNFDDLLEYLIENNLLAQDFIYQATALEYLLKHDQSLEYSLELASDIDYQTKDLSSGVLANLLAEDNLKDDLIEKKNKINQILEID